MPEGHAPPFDVEQELMHRGAAEFTNSSRPGIISPGRSRKMPSWVPLLVASRRAYADSETCIARGLILAGSPRQ